MTAGGTGGKGSKSVEGGQRFQEDTTLGLKKSGEVKAQNPNKQEVYAMIPLKRGREGRKEG